MDGSENMNIDFKKTAIRVGIWILISFVGISILFLIFDLKDWSVLEGNEGVLFVGAFIGYMASYMKDVIKEVN